MDRKYNGWICDTTDGIKYNVCKLNGGIVNKTEGSKIKRMDL
jgi:hypothetical protein